VVPALVHFCRKKTATFYVGSSGTLMVAMSAGSTVTVPSHHRAQLSP